MNKTVQKAIRAEYTLLRVPLAVLDQRVVSRLDEHSPVRATFERGLRSLDAAAARLLEHGADPHGADPHEVEPDEVEPDVLPADEQEEVEQLTEVYAAEQENHTLAGELADDDELRRVQAELRAKHRVEEAHETER
jgi:hypothetical protein